MVTIHIRDVAGAADTTAQGLRAWAAISGALRDHEVVTVSFAGVSTATSSFVNVTFVRLLDIMHLDAIKIRVRVIDSTRQINSIIKDRLMKESLLAVA